MKEETIMVIRHEEYKLPSAGGEWGKAVAFGGALYCVFSLTTLLARCRSGAETSGRSYS